MSRAKGNIAADIIGSIERVTGQWAQTKKSEERHPGYVSFRRARLTSRRGLSQKEAAARVMEEAYLAASNNGTLPANARQVMYAARPKIQALTGGRRLDDQYFCQVLLPDYIEEYGLAWDVVFDARGHFAEPHEGNEEKLVNLGTLGVRDYLAALGEAEFDDADLRPAKVRTCGPDGNFGGVLFVEKEGFDSLFASVRLGDRHDIAIMSTKGVSVTAARALVDQMCAEHDIPLLVLHDFDVAGFTILDTLRRDTRRYRFANDIKVIDLGLRLADVEAMGLQAEAAASSKTRPAAIRARLLASGATPAEAQFLLQRRVELNAMTSGQLVAFVEGKLAEHGIAKLIPDRERLEEAYRLFERGERLRQAFDEIKEDFDDEDSTVPVPADLQERVAKILAKRPQLRWDAAIGEILRGRVP